MVAEDEFNGRPAPDDSAWRVLSFCAANNIATDEAVLISTVCAWMEAEGVPREKLLEGVTRAIAYGWLDVGARPGEVFLSELGFAYMPRSARRSPLRL